MTIRRGMVLAIADECSGLLVRMDCGKLIAGQFNISLTPTMMNASVSQLLIVNLLLQLVDGLASYHIISAGVPEENPIVASAIANWGVSGGLLYSKALGCALVILIFLLRHKVEVIATQGLTVLAYVYSCLGVFLMVKMALMFT